MTSRQMVSGLIPLAVAAAVATPLATARNHPAAHAASTTVGVSGKEFKFRLATSSARHGVVVFRFTNHGKLGHNFKIAGRKTPTIQPGHSATLRVTLRAGRYTYICTVPGHAASGMKGSFRVS